MGHATIETWVEEGVGHLQLRRPEKRNALSTEVFEELTAVLDGWRHDDDVAVVVFYGTEEYFSAGLDLEVLDNPDDDTRLRWYDATYNGYLSILEYPKPTIAAVAGPTFGGGCDIAVFCDLRVAAPNAVLGFPQVRFGLTPFFDPLWRIVGLSQAKLLVLTGRRIDVAEAERIGLVDVTCAEGELLATATGLGREIAATGTRTAMRATEMVRRIPSMDQAAAYAYSHVQYRDSHWTPEVNARIATAFASLRSAS